MCYNNSGEARLETPGRVYMQRDLIITNRTTDDEGVEHITLTLNGKRYYDYTLRRNNAFTSTPFYEPFFGWFVAEGWDTLSGPDYNYANGLLIIYHKVGEVDTNMPWLPVIDWSTHDGYDYLKYV
jgi:hypothetical protein